MFVTLMYHIIDASIDAFIAIPPTQLKDQLAYLSDNNYQIIDLETAIKIALGQEFPSYKGVLLTFDDGYLDNIDTALPILLEYQATATLFVPTLYVGRNNRWNLRAPYDKSHAGWKQLQQWAACGLAIGGHTHDHMCMVRLNELEIAETLDINNRLLEDNLGISPRAFAYPYGIYNERAIRQVAQRYDIAFSVDDGNWNVLLGRHTIRRLPINPNWDTASFGLHIAKCFENTRLNDF